LISFLFSDIYTPVVRIVVQFANANGAY